MKVLLFLLFCVTLHAQERAQLVGVIRDATGAAVPGTDVSLYNVDIGVRRSTRTDHQGFYAVSSLRAGHYKITVRRPGFRTISRTGVLLGPTERGRVDFLLEIGGTHEVVTVEGAAEPINSNDATSLVVVSRDRINDLPLNNRGLQAIPEFMPGLVITPATRGEAGQFTANGQRPNTNYFTVDGVSVNNGIAGSGLPGEFSAGALPGMTAIGSLHGLVASGEIDEVRVQTSTFAPEYGRLPGAQVAVVTRSGSNDLHGEFFGAWRPRQLGAVDAFSKRAGLDPKRASANSAGGILSGPLVRDRFFFSAGSEWLEVTQAAAWRMAVPSLELRNAASPVARRVLNAFPIPHANLTPVASEHTAQTAWPGNVLTNSFRTDLAIAPNALAFVRYSRSSSENRAGYVQANDARFTTHTFAAGVLSSFGPTITSDARIGISSTSVDSSWQLLGSGGAEPLDIGNVAMPEAFGVRSVYALSVPGFGQFLSADRARSRQAHWNLMETLAVNVNGHQLRFGIDYQRIMPEREQPINGVIGIYSSLADLVAGAPPAIQHLYAASGTSTIESFSTFVQDTWQVTPRLNLTYGTRWEITPAPTYNGFPTGNSLVTTPVIRPPEFLNPAPPPPVWRTRYNQFAPRAGAAYRLSRDGSFVLRAGTGLFYDLGFSSVTDILNGVPFNRWTVNLAGLPVSTGSQGYGYAPDLRLPWSLHWNVTLEKLLTKDTVASAAYVGSRGRRLLRIEATPQLVLAGNGGSSDYHSLQLQVRRTLARRLRGFAAYTWGHSIDNGSWNSATFMLFPGATDRGSSDFDVRHSLYSGVVYDVANGWTLSGIFRARTGFPVDVLTQENPFGIAFDNQRPNLVPGVPVWIGDQLNPAAFASSISGQQGNLGRNSIRGFGLGQLDLSLQRQFSIGERASANVRLEAYNITNHASFADPVRFLSSPLFGQSVSQTNLFLGTGRAHSGLTPALQPGGPRALQLRVDFRF